MNIDWANGDWENALLEASNGQVAPSEIAATIAASEGENDESNWIAIVRLADGRLAFVDAGCDYTGWDCQAWGSIARRAVAGVTGAETRRRCVVNINPLYLYMAGSVLFFLGSLIAVMREP